MTVLRSRKWLAFAFILLTLGLFYNSAWLSYWLYPISYKKDIQLSASQHSVDPRLIAAIIRVESNYKPDVVSHKGAVGMMQIMPNTAEWIITEAGYSELTIDKLKRVDVNIEVGAWYVAALTRQFAEDVPPNDRYNRVAVVAAAYNAGPGNVRKWLNAGTWDGQATQLNRVPYGETRHYIQRVLYYYKKYEQLYTEETLDRL